ncbi:MAG TPA: transposase [Desulfobacteraceae bacterium]|nr:transposase [Desulfobacteraceae bacterium]
MYKKTNPQQKLFSVDSQISPTLSNRLKNSWAHFFRIEVLPILFKNEDQYAMLYGKTGRPNFSVARLLGLCLLQEWNSLSDQQTLDAFGFDIRWRYALDVSDEEDYLSRRSLVEFRRRLAMNDPEMNLIRNVFDNVRDSAIKKLKLSASNQRLDSTHIISNIRTRSRLDLFSNTLTLFLKSLDKDQFSRVPEPIQKWHISESEGWFGLGPSKQKVKLQQLVQYLYELIVIFEKENDIKTKDPYQLLDRLFNDQCEIKKELPGNKDASGENKIQIKKKPGGESLQSPYDPDASYGHKGTGYSAHIAETCNNPGKTEIITDYEVHGAARSDIAKMIPVIERLESAGLKPETLFADGGYPSVPSALKVIEEGIDFMAPVNRSRLPDEVMGRDLFEFDSDGFAVKCPMDHSPIDHRILSANNTKRRALHAIFDGDICRSCVFLDQCPVCAPNHRVRGCDHRDTNGDFRLEISPTLRLRDQMYADQQTTEWKDRYKIRAGIEATMSELKRSHGFSKLRVRRAVKVCFAVACKVTACNIKRWAKAYAGSGSPLQRFILTISGRLNDFLTDLIEISIILRICRSLQFL